MTRILTEDDRANKELNQREKEKLKCISIIQLDIKEEPNVIVERSSEHEPYDPSRDPYQ